MHSGRVLAGTAIVAMLAAACGSGGEGSARPAARAKLRGSVTVFAASSLTVAFRALGEEFEVAHPGTTISFNFGSSSGLVTQIEQGAPADVFAAADETSMNRLIAAETRSGERVAPGGPVEFARNTLAIAVERGNPRRITALRDLARRDLVVVLCDRSAPCGRLADRVLSNAGVRITPASREVTAKATLSKVELGEADAAIVYASDVATSTAVDGVDIPDDVNAVTRLSLVTLGRAADRAVARAWVDFVVGHRVELAASYGFVAP